MSGVGSSTQLAAATTEAATVSTAVPADTDRISSSPTLTAADMKELEELRLRNQLLRAENAELQSKLEDERTQRRQSQLDENHYSLEAKACREAIEKIDSKAQVLALHDELHRLRKKCDIYAAALEESRSYFFEMKRLYMEVSPHLRSFSGDAPAHHAAPS
ncbi:conserved hypothetical protein [Leishmania braziliensis MHOM/BR/75/M2904]|uniref:Uncharacterized protein n=2 Tax=Viannia TaxID=37616 RepID=A4H719_LEIBR|nr:conserved hypothetical protein [Leishmania braziliensis MHOM/BR/75/M2904]KAI5688615.1 hypothetical protein MNV84_01663 [Leishmania braziliensis]CAJ2468566.1 unnamed protein product [Leishmania braziliensis]CAJ2469129.1 unnamed protein product [Leishmania braziliensis]CAM45574.1 conserved hypothetical protein [Leishmania braziliensis MHOM/BR/75/M2904]